MLTVPEIPRDDEARVGVRRHGVLEQRRQRCVVNVGELERTTGGISIVIGESMTEVGSAYQPETTLSAC